MYIVIDRIEEEIAVCEIDEEVYRHIPLCELPKGVQEGDVLSVTGVLGDANAVIVIDREETQRRRIAAKALLEKLKNKR